MQYFGDYNKGETVRIPFNTSGADGASITIATNGTPKAYIDGGTTEITSGVTLTEDQDAITGRHFIVVDTTGSGFTIGSDVDVAIDANTIDGKTVNAWVGKFSLNKKTALTPVVGLAQAGAAGSVTLPASASATNDLYKGGIVTIVYATGAGQSRLITGYVGSTKVASVDPNWATTPDSTSQLVVTATAPSPATALPDVNTKTVGGTTQTGRDLGASVLISSGTGMGQLDVTSGVVKSNLAQILGTALTETAGQIAAGFKQFFNIASPTSTMNTITAVTTTTTATNLTNAPTAGDLTATMKTSVKTQITDALNVDTYAEPSSVPAATTTLVNKIGFLMAKARNKVTQTATTQLVRNDADAATIATSTVSDDGTTFTRGKFV